MRLNKYISHNTKYSRREADRLIEEGAVKINGKSVESHGIEVGNMDRVTIHGKTVQPRKRGEVTMVVYNKPSGVLVTKKDDRGRATIYHKLPGKFRHFIPVGRLDYASKGLLILTDNPEVADIMMRSSLPRSYNIKIDMPLTPEMVDAMTNGLYLEDARAGGHEKSGVESMRFAPFLSVVERGTSGKYTKLRVTIAEGKNRELRRFFAHFGANVLDLKRVSFGTVELNNLPENKTRYYTRKEYEELHKFLKEVRKDDKKRSREQL
jgi:23S rRNA pseudouridine2605 synthase